MLLWNTHAWRQAYKNTHMWVGTDKSHISLVSHNKATYLSTRVSSILLCSPQPGFVYQSYSHISLSIYHLFTMFSITPHLTLIPLHIQIVCKNKSRTCELRLPYFLYSSPPKAIWVTFAVESITPFCSSAYSKFSWRDWSFPQRPGLTEAPAPELGCA